MTQTIAEQQTVAVEVLGECSISVPGRIERFVDGQLHISITHLIDVKSRVRILLPDEGTLEGQISFQSAGPENCVIGVCIEPTSVEDLRRESRSPHSDAVTVILLEQNVDAKFSGDVQDRSRNGLGLSMNARVPLGAWVKVELADSLLFGEIKHCMPQENGTYRVGIATDTVIRRVRS